jgi:LysM repeat protein
MDLNKTFIKSYQDKRLVDLVDAPVEAIQGVSKKDAELLNEAFNVKTVRDLAELKYSLWAREICELADSGAKVSSMAPFKDKLDKKYEKKTPAAIAKAPIHALQGISKKDAALMDVAFHIKTVRDLGELKYIKIAQMTLDQARMDDTVVKEPIKWKPYLKWGSVLFLVIIAVIILVFLWPTIHRSTDSRTGISELEKIPPYGPAQITESKQGTETAAKAPQAHTAKTAQRAPETAVSGRQSTPAEPDDGKYYTVKKSDTLWDISKEQTGTIRNWKSIYEANREKIKDPQFIFPGQRLTIPGRK